MKFIVLDLEVTGYDPGRDRVLEVGAVRLDTVTGEMAKVYDERVRYDDMREYDDGYSFGGRPGCWIYQEGYMCVEDNLNAEKGRDEVISDLRSLLKGKTVAFYGSNDMKVLRQWGLDDVVRGYLDLVNVSTDCIKDMISGMGEVPDLIVKRLDDLRNSRPIGVLDTYRFLVEDDPLRVTASPHRAYPDALIESYILRAVCRYYGGRFIQVARRSGSLRTIPHRRSR
ncbi:MAG: hypothetical protein MJZ68_07720 [archaeon]|nr:hypothetical protein [archaeon]